VEFLPTVFATGWTSGVNAYLCVLMLGLLSRFGDVTGIPPGLGRTEVLVIAGAMFAIEAVVDKIPYLDSGWDAISTVLRPTVGAVLGLLISSDGSSAQQALMAVAGGGTALMSHLTKSSLRLAVNSSPEPASNITASTGEDLAVAGITALVAFHPWLAFGITLAVLVLGIVLAAVLARSIRRGYRRWRDHRRRAFAAV
jgi:heme exporter protein D